MSEQRRRPKESTHFADCWNCHPDCAFELIGEAMAHLRRVVTVAESSTAATSPAVVQARAWLREVDPVGSRQSTTAEPPGEGEG